MVVFGRGAGVIGGKRPTVRRRAMQSNASDYDQLAASGQGLQTIVRRFVILI